MNPNDAMYMVLSVYWPLSMFCVFVLLYLHVYGISKQSTSKNDIMCRTSVNLSDSRVIRTHNQLVCKSSLAKLLGGLFTNWVAVGSNHVAVT